MNEANNVKSSGLIGQRDERIEKIAKLRALGIDPFPARSIKSHKNSEVIENYTELEGQKATLTGRLMSWREHGGLVFADVQDQGGSLQLYFRKDDYTGEISKGQLSWDTLNLLDIGDFVEATGLITKTKRGEISLQMESVRLISKSIRPLPEKWKGLADKEDRYRRRYLDLTMNQEVRERFLRKAKFWQANRQFLQDRGFIEVETPVLEHKTGGADARPFETFHNDLGEKLYMRISSELYQKRLIGGGFEKVYTLGPNFRNEGLSDEHLQEYYQVEWYWAYADYKDNMQLVKEMFRHVAKAVYGKTDFETRGHKFDLADEWTEIDYVNTIKDKLGVDIFKDSNEKMAKILGEKGVVLDGEPNRNRLIDNLWKTIRKSLSGPAFLVNEPKFMSPLAKSKPENAELTERFHVIIAGSELGNGYSEINDPIDQLERFTAQEDLRESGDDEAQMLDIDFVEMLEYGMPPVSGYGHSERVFWFLEDITAREGTLFPLMRYHIDDTTKKIYGSVVRDDIVAITHEEKVSTSVTVATNNINNLSAHKVLPSLEFSEKLLVENVADDYQRLHARMVATAMREYATIMANKYPVEAQAKPEEFNPELWYTTGLIHDWDYGFDPEGHPERNTDKLLDMGYPQIVIDAILGHKLELGVPLTTRLSQALVAIDELSGLFFAYSKFKQGYKNMEASGLRKKFKDKAFAAKINRNDIQTGVEKLGISLEEHIANMLAILQKFEQSLGS